MGRAAFQGALVAFVLGCSEASQDPQRTGEAGGVARGGSSGAGGGGGTSAGSGGQAGVAGSSAAAGSGASGGAGQSGGGGGSSGGSGAGSGGGGAGGDPGSGCDPGLAATNRALVGRAIDRLFVDKQVDAAIDEYWAEPYLQHNPGAPSGLTTFRSIMRSFVLQPSFSYERLRTFAECDLVVVQGRYSGTGVIFDMFRVKDGKLMEHWDSGANQASDASGPAELADLELTGQNRAHVLSFIEQVLIAGTHASVPELLGAGYVEHRSTSASGPEAFLEYVVEDGITYSEVHHVIADGNFVFTLSEGDLDGQANGFYDLFRLDGGRIVEHWDSRLRVPASTESGLSIF